MSILVDHQINELCDCGLVTPCDRSLINPASLDVRIGESAIAERTIILKPQVETKDILGVLHRLLTIFKPKQKIIEWVELDLKDYSKESPYWMQPKELILVAILESINIPVDVVGELKLKSSRAREGWDNALAFHLDPGYQGVPTLELINQCRYSRIPLYSGLRIGQIIFHSCEEPTRSYKETGRYNDATTVEASKG